MQLNLLMIQWIYGWPKCWNWRLWCYRTRSMHVVRCLPSNCRLSFWQIEVVVWVQETMMSCWASNQSCCQNANLPPIYCGGILRIKNQWEGDWRRLELTQRRDWVSSSDFGEVFLPKRTSELPRPSLVSRGQMIWCFLKPIRYGP